MISKKYFIQTFGCQMNVADSDLIGGELLRMGMQCAEDIKDAQVIVLNTCSVREHAEHRALSFIGRLKPLKKKNPDLKIIVAGCVAERLGKELKRRFPIVDMVIGAKKIEKFPEMLSSTFKDKNVDSSLRKQGLYHSGMTTFENPPVSPFRKGGIVRKEDIKVSAFVAIMRGCDNYCSYCIVPYVRGEEKSRAVEEIISEIESLVRQGVKEVTLLGQNVNSFKSSSEFIVRSSEKKTTDFSGLLEKINNIDGLERIRFMTSHPKDTGDRLINAMAELKKVCKHIHLPLQSGSDKILKAMNRKYTSGDYKKIVEKLREKIPDISITTDILVGFPGETQNDFDRTLKMVEEIGFEFLFAFKYSPRPGTGAEKLPDNVPLETKEERLSKILSTANDISAKKNAKLLYSVQEVLVEDEIDGHAAGRTAANKKVFFPSKGNLIGKMAKVKILGAKFNSLTGRICKK